MTRTSITVSKELREELEDLRMSDETMSEMLKRVIVGSKKTIQQYHEPIAFTLEQYDEIEDKTNYIDVFWSQLIVAKENDVFDFTNKPMNCVNESAKIVIREKDYILVEFRTNGYEDYKNTFSELNLICFNIFH